MITLAGYPVETTRLYIPEYGVACADLELAAAPTLTGAATLKVGDLTMAGVVEGAPVDGTGRYAWTAGAGLWSTRVAPKGYQSALGVLRRNVLQDLTIAIAAATGGPTETLSIELPDVRLGGIQSAYVRPEGPAWHVLRALGVPWWVGPDGVTHIAERASAAAPVARADVLSRDPAEGTWTVALRDDAYSAWLPGNTINGEHIRSVLLTSEPGQPVRLRLSTTAPGMWRDIRSAINDIIAQQTDVLRFHGIYSYRVVGTDRATVDLRPELQSIGLPPLTGRELRPGIPGFSAEMLQGQIVSVGFENGDPALPYVRGAEPRYKSRPDVSWIDVVSTLKLGDGTNFVARQNDPVLGVTIVSAIDTMTLTGPLTFTDANGSSIVLTFTGGVLTTVVATGPLTAYKIGVPTQTKVKA